MRIDIKKLSFSYNKHSVLKNINFCADVGELIAVLGPNGVGKSTFFRCLLGFTGNYKGVITLDGQDIRRLERADIAKKIAYIPQYSQPIFNYTVREAVLMGVTGSLKYFQTPSERHIEMVDEKLNQLGILKLAERGCEELSGGERQLVLLARALVQDAKILVMDEPTSNLDYGNQNRVMDCIRSLGSEGYTVIFSTHDPNQALLYANRAFAIKDGKVLADGQPESVITEDCLCNLYGIRVLCGILTGADENVAVCVPAVQR